MSRQAICSIQRYFPQIYLACHVDHVRTKSNRHHLSAIDATLLAHLDEREPTAPKKLAAHLGVADSTLSAKIKRLETLGHISRQTLPRDRRRHGLLLTVKGSEAIAATSVLDSHRLKKVLSLLSFAQQKSALDGLAQLAQAARTFQLKAPRRQKW